MIVALNWRQISLSVSAVLLATVVGVLILVRAAEFGSQPLIVRAGVLSIVLFSLLLAMWPFRPDILGRNVVYVSASLGVATLLSGAYYFYYLPSLAAAGISAAQMQSELITDRSSNGIIEVGFSYPIFTPTLQVRNHELFTRELNVFLRMIDSNNESALFRAVRSQIDNPGLSVEATVQGMLSENSAYLFSPLIVPPLGSVTGRVAFVISNLNDGTTFTEALGRAYQADFELRDPETGDLLLSVPLDKM